MERVISLFTRWKANDCKASLMASAKRAQMGRNKVLVQQKKMENEIAELLGQGREEKARIKAESLVHLQKMETAYDILETLTELIQTRIQYISESTECPADLVTPIASVIYASKRLQIPEFKTALRQFNAKYGVSFTSSHADNESGQVASNLVDVLLITPPKEGEIFDLLVYIAQKHNVDWIPPKKPQTTADRNKEANPLQGSLTAAASPPVVVVDSPAKQAKADLPPAPQSKPFSYADDGQHASAPPAENPGSNANQAEDNTNNNVSQVDDPQYAELMERLRKLKLNPDGSPRND
jgi:hypothetical protein